MDAISQAHIDELRKQLATSHTQVKQLSAIVRRVPAMLASARLDAKQGTPTRYDYKAHVEALRVR